MKKMLLGLALGILIVNAGECAEETSQIVSTTPRIVEGEVSSVSKDYIAVIYKRDAQGVEYEMLLPVQAAAVQLEGIQDIKQLKTGDVIRIDYDEITTADSKGNEKLDRRTKAVKFIRPAPPELSSKEK